MSRKDRKFKGFFRQKLGDLQKKKKRSSPKFRAIFLPKFRNFKRLRGGYFPFFTENRPQKHKKHAILHTSQANGEARAPPAPPLATLLPPTHFISSRTISQTRQISEILGQVFD